MKSDALPPFQSALRWSIPGAALLSIPIGITLQNRFAQAFAPSFPQWSLSMVESMVFVWFCVFCGPVLLWTSKRALDRCMDGLNARETVLLTLILMLPNLFVAAVAGVFLIVAFFGIVFSYPVIAAVLLGVMLVAFLAMALSRRRS